MKRAVPKARPVKIDAPENTLLDKYFEKLEEFSQIPGYVLDRTVFDISGYPHYENVCSNILAFFFDPENEHGMDDLLLQALLDCVEKKQPDRPSFLQVRVEREVGTENKKRLDLVLQADGYVIGIENKIYHNVINPFGEYRKLLESRAGGNDEVLGVILAPRLVKPEKWHCGFTSISYPQFLDRLSEIMGPYLLNADPKFQHYLFDFMKTMRRLAGEAMQNEEAIRFFQNNHALLDQLTSEYYRYKDSVIPTLKGLIPDSIDGIALDNYIYQKYTFCVNIPYRENQLSLDIHYCSTGWTIAYWGRPTSNNKPAAKQNAMAVFGQLPSADTADYSFTGSGDAKVRSFPINTPVEQIAEVANSMVQQLVSLIATEGSRA